MKGIHTMRRTPRALALLALLLSITVLSVQPAPAAPVDQGSGDAFGITASIAGTEAIPPTPAVETTLADEDAAETLVDIPGDPLAVSGTLNASSAVHSASDLGSELTVVEQGVAGPFNARSVASVEELSVLLDSVGEGVALIENVDLRTEAVGVCNDDGSVSYSANTEIIDLQIGGETIPLNQPIQDLLDQLSEALEPLGDLVAFDTNVITETDDGIAVDALVLSVAEVLEGGVEIRIGHAEVGGLQCGDALPSPADPECSDGVDNDGDGDIDFPNDPGCESAEDDDERNECTDGVDNDGDGEIDFVNDQPDSADPNAPADEDGCDSRQDNDESDPGTVEEVDRGPLPSTGGTTSALMGLGAAGLMVAGLALRRRLTIG